MNKRCTGAIATTFAALLFGAAQSFRPALVELPRQELLQGAVVPPEVHRIFERACQDCHSNNTRWPWYARTVPVSWMLTRDVARGRSFMNLSEWQRYGNNRQLGYLAGMATAAVNRKMPPRIYSALHPDARLSEQERGLIATWARQEYRRVRNSGR